MYILADIERESSDFTYEYYYELKLVDSVNITTKEDQTTLPLPDQSAEESFIQAFQGESKEVTITFILYDDGTNKALDTTTDPDTNRAPTGVYDNDTVKTINEQIDYLENYIKQPDISARHRIYGGPFSAGSNSFVKGRLIEVNPQRNSSNPSHAQCDLRFVVGNVL